MSAPGEVHETAPCGCQFATIGDTFVLTACAAGEACPVVQYVQRESEAQGKPHTTLALP